MFAMAAIITPAGVPVLGTAWRQITPGPGVASADRARGIITAADWLHVELDGVRSSGLIFLRHFEPELAELEAHDPTEAAIVRANVRAYTLVAPTEAYPTTFATAWQGTTLEEHQMQMVVSHGLFCGDCTDLPEDAQRFGYRPGEVIRLAQHHRCRCGLPTLWYHVADEERTRAALAAYAGC